VSDEEAHLMDRAEVARALSVLAADGLQAGETFELRILGASILSGAFSSVEAAVDALAAHASKVRQWGGGQTGGHGTSAAYFTPNPTRRAPCRDLSVGGAVGDEQITRLRWFLLDVDPIRESQTCSTEAEKDEAWAVRERILTRLCGVLGWPRPVLCDSGNGYHALWALDLPVSDKAITKRALSALAAEFDTGGAKVDTAVWNPSRIWKLPGTLAMKGPNLPDRPWRWARLEDVPERIQRVTREQLEALALCIPVEAPRAPRSPSRAPAPLASNERPADWLARIASSANERPGDWLARNVSWADILTPHGWTQGNGYNGGESWRRPGSKKGPSERSAWVPPDGGRLFVYTSNGGALDAGDYDKIGALAKLEGLTVSEAAGLIRERFNMPAPLDGRDSARALNEPHTGNVGALEDAIQAPAAPPPGAPGAPGAPVEASTKSAAAPPPGGAPAVPKELTNGPGELPELAPNLRPPRRAMLLTRPYAPGERPEFEGAGEPGFLPRGIVAMLVGEGGGGKTQAAVQLAVAVATADLAMSRESDAGRWLGTYKATERGRVALALGEEDDEEIHRRVWFALRALEEREEAAHDGFGFDKKRGPRAVWKYADAVRENVRPWALAGVSSVFIVPVDATPRFGGPRACDPTEEFKAFEAALWRDGKPWSLVVLDPATRFLGADSETNNKAATEWMTLVHRLTKLPGNPTVLVIHHTNKAARKEGIADASASRGSSALTDGARWVATLAAPHRDDETTVCDLRLTLVKANYVRAGLPPLELVRDDEHPNYLRPMTLREKDTRTAERTREAIELEATKKGREKAIGDLAKTKSDEIKASLKPLPANVAGNASRGGAAFKASTESAAGGGDDDDQIRPR